MSEAFNRGGVDVRNPFHLAHRVAGSSRAWGIVLYRGNKGIHGGPGIVRHGTRSLLASIIPG